MTNLSVSPDIVSPVQELNFVHPQPAYKAAFLIAASLGYIILMGLALLLLLTDELWICIAAEALIAIAFIINLSIIPKAARFRGYALRELDISYRKGVFFPKITTIPYVRVQQVTLSQNPIFKLFGLYSVKVVNGAQTFDELVIPGLSSDEANNLKNFITLRLLSAND